MKLFKHLMLVILTLPVLAHAAEDWKGQPYKNTIDLSGMTGVGILDGRAGFELRGAAALKIYHMGWLNDVNDQVYVEFQPGILFVGGSQAFTYSAHLRWDFHKNEDWTLYAIGGFGGAITGLALGDRFEFFPRYGIGARWNLFEHLSFRAEISHEFTGVGAVFLL